MPQLYSPHVVFSWGEKPQSDVGKGTGVGFLLRHRAHLMPSEGNSRLFKSAYFHSRLDVYFVSPLNAFDTAGRFIEEISSFDAFTQRLQLQYGAYIFCCSCQIMATSCFATDIVESNVCHLEHQTFGHQSSRELVGLDNELFSS